MGRVCCLNWPSYVLVALLRTSVVLFLSGCGVNASEPSPTPGPGPSPTPGPGPSLAPGQGPSPIPGPENVLVADKVLLDKLNGLYKTGGSDASSFGVMLRIESSYPPCDIYAKLDKAGWNITDDWKHDENPFKVLPHINVTDCKMSASAESNFWKQIWATQSNNGYKKISGSFINQKVSSPYSATISKEKYPGGRVCGWAGFFQFGNAYAGNWGYVFNDKYAGEKARCLFPVDADTGKRTNGGCGRGMASSNSYYPKCVEQYSLKSEKGTVSYFKDFSDPSRAATTNTVYSTDIQKVEDEFNEMMKTASPSVHPWTPDYFNNGSCNECGGPACPGSAQNFFKDFSEHYNPFYKGPGFYVNSAAATAGQPQSQSAGGQQMNLGMKAQEDLYSCSYYWRTWNIASNGSHGSPEVTPEEYKEKELGRINPWPAPMWKDLAELNVAGYNEVVYDHSSFIKDIEGYVQGGSGENPIQAFYSYCNVPNYFGISPGTVQAKFAERFGLEVKADEPRVPRVVYVDLYDSEAPFKAACPSNAELCAKTGGKFCTRLTGADDQGKDLVPPAGPTPTPAPPAPAPAPRPTPNGTWQLLGEGCCHDIQYMSKDEKQYDGAWPVGGDDACEGKCETYSDCGFAIVFPGHAWCTTLKSSVACETLDNQQGDCGSSGVGVYTYKFTPKRSQVVV